MALHFKLSKVDQLLHVDKTGFLRSSHKYPDCHFRNLGFAPEIYLDRIASYMIQWSSREEMEFHNYTLHGY